MPMVMPMVVSSGQRFHLVAVGALLAVLVSALPVHASCDPSTDPDKSDIANARAAIAANCDCTVGTGHGAYVKCAVAQVNATLQMRRG